MKGGADLGVHIPDVFSIIIIIVLRMIIRKGMFFRVLLHQITLMHRQLTILDYGDSCLAKTFRKFFHVFSVQYYSYAILFEDFGQIASIDTSFNPSTLTRFTFKRSIDSRFSTLAYIL